MVGPQRRRWPRSRRSPCVSLLIASRMEKRVPISGSNNGARDTLTSLRGDAREDLQQLARVERQALGESAANERVPRSDLAIELVLRADDEIDRHGQADRLVLGRSVAQRKVARVEDNQEIRIGIRVPAAPGERAEETHLAHLGIGRPEGKSRVPQRLQDLLPIEGANAD